MACEDKAIAAGAQHYALVEGTLTRRRMEEGWSNADTLLALPTGSASTDAPSYDANPIGNLTERSMITKCTASQSSSQWDACQASGESFVDFHGYNCEQHVHYWGCTCHPGGSNPYYSAGQMQDVRDNCP
eukprot:4360173-Prymnesium_polylepis.1